MKNNYDYDLIIIGGGSAGLSLASMSARLGVKIALIDAEQLGGDCLNYGCIPSKTLIHSAAIAHAANTGKRYGVLSADVQIDWQAITTRIATVIQTIADHVDNADRFRTMGCDVYTDTYATFVDRYTVDVGSKYITGKKIAICCGTRPRVPNIEGLESVQYLTNETIFSLPKQPKSLLIIGAGPIGAEMAQAFSRLGTKVTVINKYDSLLSKEDPDVQDFMKNVFTKEGIELELGWNPIKITESGSGVIVTVQKDGATKELGAEQVLVAVGRTSNGDKLHADAAGVTFDKRGFVETNSKLQTAQKHIYAAGDISGHLQFTHSAGHEAGVVLANAILHLPAKIHLESIPWTTFTAPEVASCGLNETMVIKKGVSYEVTKFSMNHQDRALAEDATNGFIKVLHTKKGKLLGCQIVGEHAGELIHEWVIALSNNVKLSTIARTTHVYPTLAGANQQVAGIFSSKGFFTPKTRKILRWLFGYRNTEIERFKG